MNSDSMIHLMLIICFVILIIVLFSKPIKFILKLTLNATMGYIVFTIMNYLGFSVGGNIITCAVSAVLGFPGIIGILAVNALI